MSALETVMFTSEAGNVQVRYCQFDMGDRYKVYRRVCYEVEDGENKTKWEWLISLPGVVQAVDYARKIYDVLVYRPIEETEDTDE